MLDFCYFPGHNCCKVDITLIGGNSKMIMAVTYRIIVFIAASFGLCVISGCGGSDSSTPTAAAGTGTSTAASTQTSSPTPPQNTSSEDSSSQESEKPQVSYGGEESSQSQGGGFDGAGADFGDDGSGGFGLGDRDSDDGRPSGPPSRGVGGPGSGGGQAGFAGRPGRGGPSRAGAGGPSGGQFAGGRGGDNNPDSGDEDFGLGRPGTGDFDQGGLGGASEINASLASGFVGQYCIRCHSATEPKGDVRLDNLTDELKADSDLWKSVADVLEDGSMPPNQAQQPEQSTRAQIVRFIRDNLGATEEASFLQLAEAAFKSGNEDEAMKLFYSHALTVADDQAAEVLDNIRLYRPKVAKPEDLVAGTDYTVTIKPSLKTQLKLAVGIILKADENVTDVKPIGSTQAGGAGGLGGGDSGGLGGLGRGGFGQDDSGQAADNNKLTTFEDLTGDYGSALVKAFQTRRNEGHYGTLFATVRLKPGSAMGGAGNDLDSGLGAGAEDDERGDTFGAGGFGDDRSDAGGLAGAGPGGRGGDGLGMGGGLGLGGNDSPGPSKTQPGQTLANGLIYIGKGKINELFKKSVEMGADGVFLFDVTSTKNNRTNLVTTDTRLRFLLISGKVVATASKFLNNREIERLSTQSKDSGEVQKQVDQIFSRMDQVLAMESVPKMSESAALKHLHGLVHSEASPLQIMAQARLFQSKGIITSDQLSMLYQIVLEGNEGIALASGTEADRRLVLDTVKSKL